MLKKAQGWTVRQLVEYLQRDPTVQDYKVLLFGAEVNNVTDKIVFIPTHKEKQLAILGDDED